MPPSRRRSFNIMTARRLERRYRGVYKRVRAEFRQKDVACDGSHRWLYCVFAKYSLWTKIITWFIVLYVLMVLLALSIEGVEEVTTSAKSSGASGVLSLILLILFIYIMVKFGLLFRWVIYWALLAIMIMFIITSDVDPTFWDDDKLSSAKKNACYGVLIGLAVVEVLTIVVHIFTHFVYPKLVANNKLATDSWWQVQRCSWRANTVTYRSRARFYTRKRNHITYVGGLNGDGQPHGYGVWTDTSYHGERLTGQWEDGVPVGPFRSFEHGSGYCFVNLRVAFCHVRGEEDLSQIYFFPKHSTNGLNWGVASVECSVSGGFFTFLPSVTHLTSKVPPTNAAECLEHLRTPTDDVLYIDEPAKLSNMEPQQSQRRMLVHERSYPQLTGSGRGNALVPKKEALVLLHGYNCSLNYSMNRLGQLIALGDFPSHIHPFVFSWPSGGVLAYFQAKETGAESEKTAQYFGEFLRSLVDAGYSTINIIAHSMGARVYFGALNRGFLDNIFKRRGHADTDDITRARLGTLTFCNPDYERNEFVRAGGSYDRSREFCSCITLYADSLDGALFYSEFFTKGSLTAPLNYSLGKRVDMVHRDDDPETRSSMASTDSDCASIHSSRVKWSEQELEMAVTNINQQAHFRGVQNFARTHTLQQHATDASEPKPSKQTNYLDVDVIDTTWMDQNVHAVRHNYFNINSTVVDDLRHLIVNKRRASTRPGLLRTEGNMFIFLVAPAHVKND
ncbi:TPA: hypothetical protein N0F65_008814 [Lagenidium giganteum]|uniref:Uncharacterized protein n=1 Tax=Lagenidium giganteum TaxID=4803 RepID=A0AAV2YY32_9STRA|nr:TPA: hypothetical protein N0F65_008814 [Lagenidium giganteum]